MILTEREMQVLEYICKGYQGPQIARELVVTFSTVRAHTLAIMRKLGAKTQAQAVFIALDKKFI